MKKEINIPVSGVILKGDLYEPEQARGLVIFSHGSGSSRLSPRNRLVAGTLQANGFATLLFDLLTPEEGVEQRFNIELLTSRLVDTTYWIRKQIGCIPWNIGYFGASTGAASALKAASAIGPDIIKAVVSRGGRPDLASSAFHIIKSPTLLIVGEQDSEVIKLNKQVYSQLTCSKELKIIPGATHLFEEPGTLKQVSRYATEWFLKYLYRYQLTFEKDFMG